MIDKDGYRSNVGIVICNTRNQVFWGKRVRQDSWQFPQGGIKHGESPEQAMFRELMEEVGLAPEHVRILGRTRDWMRYDVPRAWVICCVWSAANVTCGCAPPRIPSSTPGVGATTGRRSRPWWNSNARSTAWRSPNSNALFPRMHSIITCATLSA